MARDHGASEPADNDGAAANRADFIRYRATDGQWHEISVEPKRTGDPELDAIWAMSFDELEAILRDESHPLHEKAQQVSAEIVKPIVEAVRPFTESFTKSLDMSAAFKAVTPKIDLSGLYPAPDASWFAKLLPKLPKFELPDTLIGQGTASARTGPSAPLDVPGYRQIDFETVEPPDASLAEIQEAAEARAHELRSTQVEILGNLLLEARASAESGKEALDVSKQALDETRSSKRAGWIAAWAAIGAVLIGISGIIVTFLVS